MGFARGKFGIEYNATARNGGDRHLMWWVLAGVAVLGVLTVVSLRGCRPYTKWPAPVLTFSPPPAAVTPASGPAAASAPASVPVTNAPPSRAARQVQRWLADSAGRPAAERNLLERLLAAERAGDAQLARDTLERLRQRPAMADLDEPLAHRLGVLNFAWLFSSRPTPWTASVTVRRGDSYHRIAREHGTTLAAVLALNRVSDPAAPPVPGTILRVPDFPRAALVVHRQTKQADLTLNGKFFKRYYVSTGAATRVGAYPITREVGPRTRFKALGIVFAPSDLDEIAMLLPPGASLAVTSP